MDVLSTKAQEDLVLDLVLVIRQDQGLVLGQDPCLAAADLAIGAEHLLAVLAVAHNPQVLDMELALALGLALDPILAPILVLGLALDLALDLALAPILAPVLALVPVLVLGLALALVRVRARDQDRSLIRGPPPTLRAVPVRTLVEVMRIIQLMTRDWPQRTRYLFLVLETTLC